MRLSTTLTVGAVICLVAATFLARGHLRERRGLRPIFAGLLVAALSGLAINLASSLSTARVLCLLILVGVALIVRGIHIDKLQTDGCDVRVKQ